jgi:hypothetical protein
MKTFDILKHKNLSIIGDKPFNALPAWFRNAETEDMIVETEMRKVAVLTGIWLNGTWEDGSARSMVFVNGIWKNGVFSYGIWKDGLWENGRFVSSNWHNGTWKTGVFEDSSWYNGTWENGGFRSGSVWHYGHWLDGEWNGLKWCDGNFITGKHKGAEILGFDSKGNKIYTDAGKNHKKHENLSIRGTDFQDLPQWFQDAETKNAVVDFDGTTFNWHNGIWKNGTWKGTETCAEWHRGVWLDGTWEGGNWYKGVWKGGTWQWGYWHGGRWENGTWLTGKSKNSLHSKFSSGPPYEAQNVSPPEYFLGEIE